MRILYQLGQRMKTVWTVRHTKKIIDTFTLATHRFFPYLNLDRLLIPFPLYCFHCFVSLSSSSSSFPYFPWLYHSFDTHSHLENEKKKSNSIFNSIKFLKNWEKKSHKQFIEQLSIDPMSCDRHYRDERKTES